MVALGIVRSAGSTRVIVALIVAFVALAFLRIATRTSGVFSLGGATLVMVGALFILRWYFPPVAANLITPLAAQYYDRDGALVASAVMICVFAPFYSLGRFLPLFGRRHAAPGPWNSVSGSFGDLIAAGIVLILIRLVTGLAFHVGVPGQHAAAIPFIGVVYYVSTYGPLAAAALILWLGRDQQSSLFVAGSLLLCDIAVESLLGSHGTPFLALLVFGASRAGAARPIRLTIGKALPLAALVSAVLVSALLVSFVARRTLNGGSRQSIADVPVFIFNRLGGLEYVAPVIGAVNETGPDLHRLRSSTWNNYLTVDVYGLPAGTQTGFAATAVGWWYGLRRLEGVAIGAGFFALIAGLFDQFTYSRRARRSLTAFVLSIAVLLGWATFLLGGTIGSLGGISIGFTVTALLLAGGHQLLLMTAFPDLKAPGSGRSPTALSRSARVPVDPGSH
jgi:hypothetical protein